jgi:hypothetical protein
MGKQSENKNKLTINSTSAAPAGSARTREKSTSAAASAADMSTSPVTLCLVTMPPPPPALPDVAAARNAWSTSRSRLRTKAPEVVCEQNTTSVKSPVRKLKNRLTAPLTKRSSRCASCLAPVARALPWYSPESHASCKVARAPRAAAAAWCSRYAHTNRSDASPGVTP